MNEPLRLTNRLNFGTIMAIIATKITMRVLITIFVNYRMLSDARLL